MGAAAAEDTLLSEVAARASAESGSRSYGARTAALGRRLAPYLADPDPSSLAGCLPADGAGPQAAGPAVAHALAVVEGPRRAPRSRRWPCSRWVGGRAR
ncbi:hypothetical protein ACFSNO_26375 [Streptomyces cirratus]